MSSAGNELNSPNLTSAGAASERLQNSETGSQEGELRERIRGSVAFVSDHPQWLGWAGLLLAFLFLLIRLGFEDGSGIGMWISSDTLYPVNVFTDVLKDGYSFSSWRFSIAPCWFPDLAATGLFWLITQNVILATLLAGFIQVAAIVGAFHIIGKAIEIQSLRLQDTLLLGTGVAITVYVAFHTGEYYPAMRQLFLPQSHIGSMLLVLYAWGMVLQMVRWQLDGIS